MELFITRRPLVIMLLVATAVTVMGQMENMSDGKVDNSSQLEVGKGRGHPNKPLRSSQPLRSGPRGRRKNIWSYNLGHRSLAFLVAGEVEVGTPPTMGLDQHCVGCCGAGETLIGRRSADLNIPNTIRRSVTQKKELTGIGTEPNSVADPCLGCCVIHMTPTPAQAKQTTPGIAAGTDRAPRRQTPNQPWRGQAATGRDAGEMCGRKGCLQDWSSESSSSSEETSEEVFHGARNSRVGSRRTMIKQKPGNPCRYLGCRSPLGSFSDSSSEED